MTITRDLYAARNLDFAPVLELDYSGPPLPVSGTSVSMQVRLYANAPDAPLAQDTSAGLLDAPHSTDPDLRTITVEPVIAKDTLAALPTGLNKPEVGEADRYEYEIKLTYADGAQDVLWAGGFILEPGVDRT
ncbi:hypothetical protein OSJ57_00030 [Sphingomonas sp. HH69]